MADLLFLELACSDALMSLATKLANLHKVEVSRSEKKLKKKHALRYKNVKGFQPG